MKIKILILAFMHILIVACNKENITSVDNMESSNFNSNKIDTTKIPMSITKFNEALSYLVNHSKSTNARITSTNTANLNPLPNTAPATANYLYVRFKPTNEEQLYTLTEGGCNFELFEEPLHDENFEFTGDDYLDPNIPTEQFPWFYTCVPVGYPLPSGIQYEILQQLFLFNEFTDEPADIEDSWGGEVEDKPDSTEGTSNYRINQIQSVTEWMQQNGNPIDKATKWIQTNYPNISIKSLYFYTNTTSNLHDGNPPIECTDDNPCGGGTPGSSGCAYKSRYYPQGTLYVRNTSTNTNDPLKQVKVRTRHIFKLGKAYANNNGYFKGNKGYKYDKKVRVIVKFKNPDTKVRAAMGNGRFWQFWFPVRHKFSKMKNCDLESINYTFANDGNNQSKATRKWSAATYLTAHYDMKNYCTQEGIIPPNRVKVWMTNGQQGLRAFAPMLNYTLSWATGSQKLNVLSFSVDMAVFSIPFIGPILVTIKKIVELSRPDVMIPISNNGAIFQSEDLYNTIFHELSHAAHYKNMGYQGGWTNASNYWVDNGIYLIGHSNDCSQFENGYGCKDLSIGQQRTALIEAWAFFAGNTFTSRYFNSNPSQISQNIKINELRQIEYQTPTNTNDVRGILAGSTSSRGWIPFGLFNDLTDVTNPAETVDNIVNPNNLSDFGVDGVNGYSMLQVVNAITSSTTTIQGFSQNFINANGTSQQIEINNLVRRYGY